MDLELDTDRTDISSFDEKALVQDIARYKTQMFVTWHCFTCTEKTVWRSPRLWGMMAKLAGVSVTVALITVCVVPQPGVLKVGKFTEISKFLNVVVGLLLGFFISSSMARWFGCVDGFLQMLDAIRNLQLQFIGLGVPKYELGLCMRYGLLSAWLEYFSLLDDADPTITLAGPERMDAMFIKLQRESARMRRIANEASPMMHDAPKIQMLFSKSELLALRDTHDPAAMMWVWVAGLIGRLAQDGFIPPMETPTYGRIMNLCEQAHSGIREIAGAMKVQPPLIYTHLLATLVHINNLLNSVTLGVVLGLATGTALQSWKVHPVWPGGESMEETQRDSQTAIVTFMYCFLGPGIFQAFLLIGMQLAQPFDSDEARIPLHRFLISLERDIQDGSMVASQMIFEKPCFKPPCRTSGEIVPPGLHDASLCWAAD